MPPTVTRGCGTRVAGGLYLETHLSDRGRPVEDFLMDPVKPLEMNIARIGVTFVEHPVTKVVNVLDWVGGEHYPNVADFVEEVKRFGLSRRIAATAPIGRLTSDSKILLVHGRAYVGNYAEYDDPGCQAMFCPKRLVGHCYDASGLIPDALYAHRTPPMCSALWWEDVSGGEDEPAFGARATKRTMPSFTYQARRRPDNVKPAYQPAIFAAFPIGQLTVIVDPVGRTHEKTLRAAEAAGVWLPITQEDA